MGKVPKWFDRKFDFSFPVELYPNLCVRLRGTPARLEELLRRCSREVLLRKPEGKWSAQEHVGHLLDVEPVNMARVNDFAMNANELTTADLSNRKTHEANHNGRAISEIFAEFRKARIATVNCVETKDPTVFGRCLLHPRLQKPMRFVDLLYFVAEHDDHHLATIWDLITRI